MTTGLDFLKVTIASGQQNSPVLNLPNGAIVGIAFPSTLTGTAISFEGVIEGSTFFSIYKIDQITLLSAPFTANSIVTFPPIETAAVPKKFRLNTGAAESAARTVYVLHRALS